MPLVSKLLLVSAVSYAGLILFVCVHPIGRQVGLTVLKTPTPQAFAATLWMFATAVVFVFGSKETGAGKTASRGYLGCIAAIIAVLIVIFAGFIPDTWPQLESEIFVSNLLAASMLPPVFVFFIGLWKGRQS